MNRVIDNLPTGSWFLNKLILIDPLALEFSNFNNLVRWLGYHPSRTIVVYYLDDTLQEAIGLQGLSSPVQDGPFFFAGELVQNCTQK
jgi:hypothetical protein